MKTIRQDAAIAALVSNPTVREASKASGIPERTLWRYLGQEDFSKRLDEERSKLVSDATDRLKSKLAAATSAIAEVMEDQDAPPQTRVNAAKVILEFSLKYSEMSDIIHRLDELERQAMAEDGT